MTALSTQIRERIVAETGSAAPSTDDVAAFEAWFAAIKDTNEDLYAGIASEIESYIMTKAM